MDRENTKELYREEVILAEKEKFGMIRESLINDLRTEYGKDLVNKALLKVNLRLTGSLDGKALSDLYRHSTKLIE